MSTVILLVVSAAWLAVLLPPLVRSRIHGSPTNTVTNFRRQLNSLEHAGGRHPGRQLRQMSRPLVSAPERPGARGARVMREPNRLGGMTGALVRPEGSRQHRSSRMVSERELLRRRRQNIVVSLAATVFVSFFLAITSGSRMFFYIFAISLLSASAYCYLLVQLRIRRENEAYYRRFH